MPLQALFRDLSSWSGRSPWSPRRLWRRRRMRAFLRLVRPPAGARIVDLGGSSWVWEMIDHDFDVTLVNLPGSPRPPEGSRYRFVEGDACDLAGTFDDGSFDVVFSNSVVEHVGDADRQEAFASEVRRLAGAFWIQTPDPAFPVEAHTGVPFYWQRSDSARARMIDSWTRALPAWTEMIQETRPVWPDRLRELFPGARIYTERVMGLAKSRTAYLPYRAG